MGSGYIFYVKNVLAVFASKEFRGWGRKRTGCFALWCHRIFGGKLTLLEDGFICYVGTRRDDTFSYVSDDIGIYYDATRPSRLENILNTYDFTSDNDLMAEAGKAIALIKQYHVSKYNNSFAVDEHFKNKYKMTDAYIHQEKILIVAQTSGDMSLKYGTTENFNTNDMIEAAVNENPDATVYIKIHPDVLSGKKESDIDIKKAKEHCIVIDENVNPISLLQYFSKVYTKTSQMGLEALLLGRECVCFGMPFYAGWGVSDDRVVCQRRQRVLSVDEIFAAAYILYTQYINPYNQSPLDINSTIKEIVNLKKIQKEQIDVKAYYFGFSRWKHAYVRPFFSEFKGQNIIFINPIFGKNHLECALQKGLSKESRIYIWGRKLFKEVEQYAQENNIKVFRVEDGFIRSVGLGSDLTQAYSQVVDSRGIYFDPTQESDLEYLLNHYDFSEDFTLLERAKNVRSYLVENKLSKYNLYDEVTLDFPKDKQIVLVPGQVEDDASMHYGAKGMDNLSLLKKVRKKCPSAYIIFKPHPDVLVGNRVGHVEEKEALKYCDEIVTEVSLDSVLKYADEVHTMTSLVGFEALIRGIEVHTYGLPFYAGWGLTIDEQICERRMRKLELNELIAGVLFIYPRYLDPRSKRLCTVETLLGALESERKHFLEAKYSKIKMETRNFMSRKLQELLSYIKYN